ncbi:MULTISPECIES: fructoselysine 6-kinase [Paenibacillus]|jgi:fructoselysine 6-kinase|nr:fructoselysine 6-kinase [Paenibacillus lactis]MBP1893844.1 fructoselysine 6-kinase [Paenibacillus lactis]MCM3492217.1 fructoselysine 6-kinase [Paenibacillus lactis]GIO92298.1 fructoselysine kinase [Paenibacillus lactis]
MRIVTVGDNCMDVYQSTGEAYPGGNPVNVAVYLTELGADTAYIGWVGTDRYGEIMVRAIQEKGVDTSRVSAKEGTTAVTYVEMAGSERKLGDYEEGVMSGFSLSPEDLRFTESFQLVHSAIWGHADRYYPFFKEKGLLTSFDFADKLDHELVTTLAPYVDYPFLSYTQDDEHIRNLMREIKARGPRIVVATLGDNGSLAYDGVQFYKHGIVEVEVVDTLGAGDSFIAGFIYGTLSGLPVDKCLEQGAQRAAKTISYFAAW